MKTKSLFLIVALFLAATTLHAADMATGTNGMVVSVNPIATRAGLAVLKNGGNAIDAAVAVALTLGVVDGHNSGIGGGCFMLIRRTNGSYVAIDGREAAPGSAKRDMFIHNGKADPSLSQKGALAVATPGALAAYDLALQRLGTTRIGEHLMAAAKIAEEGFPVDPPYAQVTRNELPNLSEFGEARAIFLNKGKPLKAGYILKQRDLARTYRCIATNGLPWFYGGPFAKATEVWMKKHGGILSAIDFKNYQPFMREPLFSNYRGYTIATMPPPSSGGVHLIQILNIVETRDLYQMRRSGSDVIHFIAEAMKLAFADRAYWLGDPDWVKVPKNLVSRTYCRELAGKIDLDSVLHLPPHGMPPNADTDVFKSMFGKHTTHFAVADSLGNWVSCTATLNTSFGSKVVIPGTGVVLNNEMDDFSIQPGVPNHFGLVGAEANAIEAYKRPLSSMTPTIVSKEGQVAFAIGAAGGPTIISQVAQTIINIIDMHMAGGPEMAEMEMTVYDALRTPRFHHQWNPDKLVMEAKWEPTILQDLQWKGSRYPLVPEDIKDPASLARRVADANNPVSVFLLDAFDSDAAQIIHDNSSHSAGQLRDVLVSQLNRIITWNGQPTILTNDVRDFWALVGKLREQKNPAVRFILSKFTTEMHKQVLESESRANLPVNFEESVLNELNRVMEIESVYDPERFAGIALPADTAKRAASILRGTDDWTRFNRTLLDKVFEGQIHKCPPGLLYTRQRFEKIKLSPDTEFLAPRVGVFARMPRLNRWLLQDAYAGEIIPCQKQGHAVETKNQWGACHILAKPAGCYVGCPDPRGWGHAEGY